MVLSLRVLRRLALPVLAIGAVVALPLSQARSGGPRPERYLPDAALLKAASITPAPPSAATSSVHLFGFNDLHGYIDPGSAGTVFNGTTSVPAGGAPQLARALEVLRQANPGSLTVAAGDLVGASPLASALFDDEPTLDILTAMGVANSSVGNHEFDKGVAELHRKQDGGCNLADTKSCSFVDPGQSPPPPAGQGTPYPGTSMRYLAANVVDSVTRQPVFPPYEVRTTADGKKIGFIGEVLKTTPQIVTPSGVAGLDFLDEAQTANSYVPQLLAQGVQTIVLVIHQGGFNGTGGTFNTCSNFTGDIVPIVQGLDSHIPVIVSGHTHAAYNCAISTPQGDKLLTSALSNGRVITDIGLTLNQDGSLSSATANNVIVATAAYTLAHTGPNGTTGDALYDRVEAIQKAADTQAAPIANQVIGAITADITRASTPAGEQPAGDLIADAQLAATQGTAAQIAFMNPGGVRNDLLFNQVSGGEPTGQVTYGEAFNVQPFGNSLVTKSLTGAQIKQLLEQQFAGCFGQTTKRILLPSAGFSYTQNLSRPACDVIDPATIKLNGTTLLPTSTYRVTMNSFLATGGDGFTTFNAGTNPVGGAQDIDALVSYFQANSPVAPPATNRIAFVAGPTPVVPEVPMTLLLPITTLALLGGAALVLGQRRRGAMA